MKKFTGVRQTGYIPSPFKKEDHVLGGSIGTPFPVLNPSGDYGDFLPVPEKQININFDTFNCTAFGTLNQIEIYMFKKFGLKVNYSDRWLGIIAGTRPPGNDPNTVYEAIRKYGLIPEEMLPFTDDIKTVEDYYSFMGGDKDACYAEGKKWLEKFDLKYKLVFTPANTLDEKINNMKVALTLSPLALSLYAWQADARGVYIRLGDDTHWLTEYAYREFQKVLDSYPPFEKDVDQEIFSCKVICIDKKKLSETPTSLWQTFLKWLQALFPNFKTT